jgi:hypothetical protein
VASTSSASPTTSAAPTTRGSSPPNGTSAASAQTRRFARDRERLAPLVHRWELFNRTTLFSCVATTGFPAVATGDFHRLEHLAGWKTLIPCAREERAVVTYLRSRRPVYLARLDDEPERLAA